MVLIRLRCGKHGIKRISAKKLAFANDMIRIYSFSTKSLMYWRGYKRAIEGALEELSDISIN